MAMKGGETDFERRILHDNESNACINTRIRYKADISTTDQFQGVLLVMTYWYEGDKHGKMKEGGGRIDGTIWRE